MFFFSKIILRIAEMEGCFISKGLQKYTLDSYYIPSLLIANTMFF